MVKVRVYFVDGTDKLYPSILQWYSTDDFFVMHRTDGKDYFRKDRVIGVQERKVP